MRTVRWGVLGTGKIAREKTIPALQKSEWCDVRAIASRDADRARAAAAPLGLPTAYGSYEALLSDPRDRSGLCLPAQPSPRALVDRGARSGQARAVREARRPERRRSGAAARRVTALPAPEDHGGLHVSSAPAVAPGRVHRARSRLRPTARHPVGVCLSQRRSRQRQEPGGHRRRCVDGHRMLLRLALPPALRHRAGAGREHHRTRPGVPDRYPHDRDSGIRRGQSSFTCSTQLASYQRVSLFGTEGRVELEIPFNAPPDAPHRLWYERRNGPVVEQSVGPHDQYAIQGDLFSRAIVDGSPVPTPLEDAVANMRVIDALFRSAARGGWEPVN